MCIFLFVLAKPTYVPPQLRNRPQSEIANRSRYQEEYELPSNLKQVEQSTWTFLHLRSLCLEVILSYSLCCVLLRKLNLFKTRVKINSLNSVIKFEYWVLIGNRNNSI